MEVFTGAGRRRAWTAGEKARIVAESYEVGETVSAVARRHALTPQQLFAWRRHARREVQDKTGLNIEQDVNIGCGRRKSASCAEFEQAPADAAKCKHFERSS
jgi:transposase-like protein